MACVYTLASSLEPKAIRYVGISKFDTADKRLKEHIRGARKKKNTGHKDNWIRSVIVNGGEIITTVIENNLLWGEACEGEKFYIREYRSLGYNLTNLTDGGDGNLGLIPSEETRGRMRNAHLGRTYGPHSIETREKLKIAQTGKKLSEETRMKMSIASPRRKMSPENKAKLLVVHLGRIVSPETRAKISATKLEKHNTLKKKELLLISNL